MRARGAATTPLFSENGRGAFRLLIYLFMACVVMIVDHRNGHLAELRRWTSLLNEPLFRIAEFPAVVVRFLRDAAQDRSALLAERDSLRDGLLVAQAQLARLSSVRDENQRLRALMGGTRNLQLQVRLAVLSDVDLDPFRHRVWIDTGASEGVREGMAVIDAGGVFGQTVEVSPYRAMVMLISDPAHAIPVQVQRTGIRTIAYGTGDVDRLHIPNIPQSADIRIGDEIVTSGLGGRFPAGLPVAQIKDIRSDATRLFLVAEAVPSALLNRSREVLLVWQSQVEADVGPPRTLMTPPADAEPSAATGPGVEP